MRKKYLRIYIGITVFLFIHFVVAKFYSEPYPSLVFPAFAKIYNRDALYDIPFQNLYLVDDKQDTTAVDKRKIFKGVTRGHILLLIRAAAHNEEVLQGKADATASIGQQKRTEMLERRQSFLNTVQANLKKEYPGKTFRYLLIEEYNRKYDLKKKALSEDGVAVKTAQIKLP